MLNPRTGQRGLTLVELMVAGTISLIAVSAVLTVYSATTRHSKLQLESAHLHQQLFGILHLIGRDLRRAGYWRFDPATQSPADNPFQQGENRLHTGAYDREPAESCVVLSYDLDRDGLVGVGRCADRDCPPFSDSDNVEQLGFRLHRGSVQSRYAGTGLACGSGFWQSLNDPDIRVTRLHFGLHTHCVSLLPAAGACDGKAPQLLQRAVSVQISARLRNAPDSEIGLVRWVALRNDPVQDAAP